jgi:hypothetical protein
MILDLKPTIVKSRFVYLKEVMYDYFKETPTLKLIQLVILILGVLVSISLFSDNAIAQEAPSPSGHAVSIHVGPLLPKSVGTTDEILNGKGFRYGYPLAESVLLESGYTQSNSKGVSYGDLNLSLRGDFPFQDLFLFGLIGADLIRIKGVGKDDYTYYASTHAGGGVLAHIADTLFLRMEMRFNFHPGTILFFGFGFEYRFGN